MSDQQDASKVFSSELVQETSKDMGLIERSLFGMESDKTIVDRVEAFVKELRASSSSGSDSDVLLKIERHFAEATASLDMGELTDFFSVLEDVMDSDEFENMFQNTPANKARLEHLRKMATVNLMFTQQFTSRIERTIEMAKEWCQ